MVRRFTRRFTDSNMRRFGLHPPYFEWVICDLPADPPLIPVEMKAEVPAPALEEASLDQLLCVALLERDLQIEDLPWWPRVRRDVVEEWIAELEQRHDALGPRHACLLSPVWKDQGWAREEAELGVLQYCLNLKPRSREYGLRSRRRQDLLAEMRRRHDALGQHRCIQQHWSSVDLVPFEPEA